MPTNNTFPSHHRLKSRKLIGQLFQSSSTAFSYPLLLKYKVLKDHPEIKELAVAFSIPKKKIKTSVLRNRIRRLIIESFRTEQRAIIPKIEGKIPAMMWIYLSDKEMDINVIKASLVQCLQELAQSLSKE